MGILDDTAIFAAIVREGGFSHAARYLGLSNGLISRRIAQLENDLGVTLIRRTTRQIHLTPEGELFWQHAQRIQREMDAAINLIQASAKKPQGAIRVSAPLHFGREYITPIIMKFLAAFEDISIDLILSNQKNDPIKEELDLIIRGAGYLDEVTLEDSSLQMRLLLKQKIGLYASAAYLSEKGEPQCPEDLSGHEMLGYIETRFFSPETKWAYKHKSRTHSITVKPKFNCTDIASSLIACTSGYGIGKFTELNARNALQKNQLVPILQQYDWGDYNLYLIYPQQQALAQRTRLLLEFINANMQEFLPVEAASV